MNKQATATSQNEVQELKDQLAVLRKQNDEYRERIEAQDKTMADLATGTLADTGKSASGLLEDELQSLRAEVEELTDLEGKRKEAAQLRKKVNSMREKDRIGNYKPPVYSVAALPADPESLKTVIYKHAVTQLQENRPEVDPTSPAIKSRLKRYTDAMTKAVSIFKDDSIKVHKAMKYRQQAAQAQTAASIELRIKPIVGMQEFGLTDIEL